MAEHCFWKRCERRTVENTTPIDGAVNPTAVNPTLELGPYQLEMKNERQKPAVT
jgi:hypothetical protein